MYSERVYSDLGGGGNIPAVESEASRPTFRSFEAPHSRNSVRHPQAAKWRTAECERGQARVAATKTSIFPFIASSGRSRNSLIIINA